MHPQNPTALDERLKRADLTIGVLSDTHGAISPEGLEVLRFCDVIVHAGDIDTPELLEALQKIAPVSAVRGNMDRGGWARGLPAQQTLISGALAIHVLHDLQTLDVEPSAAGIGLVISGHSHRPLLTSADGVLFLNPGSVSHPRGGSKPSLGVVQVRRGAPEARLIAL